MRAAPAIGLMNSAGAVPRLGMEAIQNQDEAPSGRLRPVEVMDASCVRPDRVSTSEHKCSERRLCSRRWYRDRYEGAFLRAVDLSHSLIGARLKNAAGLKYIVPAALRLV